MKPVAIRSNFITATKPPKCTGRNHTWDSWKLTLMDGSSGSCYIETTWGQCAYFEFEGRTYRIGLTGPQWGHVRNWPSHGPSHIDLRKLVDYTPEVVA